MDAIEALLEGSGGEQMIWSKIATWIMLTYSQIVASLSWSSLKEKSKPRAHANENNQRIENRQNNYMNHDDVRFSHRLKLVLSDFSARPDLGPTRRQGQSHSKAKQAHANGKNQRGENRKTTTWSMATPSRGCKIGEISEKMSSTRYKI
jgi:hypothetical protein